jgi:collagen type I/II/III/V/XI/XXIV/XXVII alpha
VQIDMNPPEAAPPKGPAYGPPEYYDNYNYHYYQYYAAKQDQPRKTEANLDMFDLIDDLKMKVFGKTKPDGSPQFPAKSCKDIQMCFPEATSGEYWLDPNGGQIDDKVKVTCDFKGDVVETCVQPTSVFDVITMNTFKQNDLTNHKWVAKSLETENAEIAYPARSSQWRNLAVGMRSGRQNVTYNCKNSPAHTTMEGAQKSFLKIRNAKNVELQTTNNGVTVVEDRCWMNDGTWQQTVVEYSTKDLSKLPLRDVAVLGSGNADEQFSLTVGKVCFST